ncbi:hypothetical protein COY23_04015 [bacterium (Candidatus Torokbacteria) CG_4_10_14_0_2_um_filter_35_8]|nr:MAG: hypothetical protein COY23_04015 [bacterium (Candidatus Torokbacteria) CG_4_10_14_0_2_um_filter_35_8]
MLKNYKKLLFHSALTLTITSALSYIAGLIRDKSLAYTFGTGSALDTYNASFIWPDFILAVFVTGALQAAFIPLFTKNREKSAKEAFKYAQNILSYFLLLLSVAGIIFAIALPFIVDYLVPGFSLEQKRQYILLTRLMLLSPLLFALSNTIGNMLVSFRDFLWYGLSPVLYNIGIITGIFLFVPKFGNLGLVFGTILGALMHFLIRAVPAFLRGFRIRLNLKYSQDIKDTIRLMAPKIIQLGMWQLLLWWFIKVASALPEGSISTYSFARNFQSVPVSLIGIAIATSAFPLLSEKFIFQKFTSFKKILIKKSFLILGITTLAAIFLAIISRFLINILLSGGNFTQEMVKATASLLLVYCISIPFESLTHILARAHYAMKNTIIPSTIHVSTILITMLLTSLLVKTYGLYSIPISFAIGLAIQVGLLTFSLTILFRKKLAKCNP